MCNTGIFPFCVRLRDNRTHRYKSPAGIFDIRPGRSICAAHSICPAGREGIYIISNVVRHISILPSGKNIELRSNISTFFDLIIGLMAERWGQRSLRKTYKLEFVAKSPAATEVTAGLMVYIILFLQVSVNSGSALLACAHGQNDGSSAGNSVAAGKYAVTGGHLVFVDNQTALPVGLQTGSGGPQ